MSLDKGFSWSHKDIHLQGYSVAGITTSIGFVEAGCLFDVAQGLPYQMPYTNVLVTHGHMDHASGIPYLIAMKAMLGQIPPEIYMPPSMVPPMREIMRAWEKIEDHAYQYRFHAVKPDHEYPLEGNYFFKTFETFHRVPSNGYTVFRRKKKLKEEFHGKPQSELGRLRQSGVEIEEHSVEAVLSFTGDTKIEYLDHCPWVAQSRVLVTELSFIDQKRTVENARYWGHLHLDELLPRLEKLQCEKIVLIHISARYTNREVEKIIRERIPEHLKHRVEVFPRP